MAVTLNQNTDCCESTCTNTTVNVAGPTGAAGAAGTNGTNGSKGTNAYAKTTSGFTVPPSGNNVNLPVDNATPWASGQAIYVQETGYYEVVHTSTNQITAKNLGYAGNTASGTSIASDRLISGAGIQGAAGANGTTFTLTGQGSLITRNSSDQTQLSAGTDSKQALFANTGAANKMEWRQPKFADFNASTDKLNLSTHSTGNLPITQINGPASVVTGDLVYWNGTSLARTGIGSDGQILTYSTTSNKPVWQSQAGALGIVASAHISAAAETGNPTVSLSTNIGQVTNGNDAWTIPFQTARASGEYFVMVTPNYIEDKSTDDVYSVFSKTAADFKIRGNRNHSHTNPFSFDFLVFQ